MKRNVLLIISGSVAAYKSLELIRRLRERDCSVRAILTKGGAEFITPLAVSSLTGEPTYGELFSLKDETEMGHIRLSRDADVVLVAPASADLIARMAAGMADDLATATLLAANKPVLLAPAMNSMMWQHPATKRNLDTLRADGMTIIPTEAGTLACGEVGDGRMAETETILAALEHTLTRSQALEGVKALVTSGPTHEAIDPVRFISNHSSGKQGHAIASALARYGAEVTLVSGPSREAVPLGVTVKPVTTAEEMWQACEQALPVDIAVCAAAVADWKVEQAFAQKLKKSASSPSPLLSLVPTVDILAELSKAGAKRPPLVIGFAAETENLAEYAQAKLRRKGCDWLLANDVSGEDVFGKDDNTIHFFHEHGSDIWPRMRKQEVAERLVQAILRHREAHQEPIRKGKPS